MGFSVSASTAIIFAGLFLAFGILFPAVSNGFDVVRDAQVDRDDAQLDLRNTAINITEANGDSITVENTGTTSLTVSEVDLIVGGDYQTRPSESEEVDYEIENVQNEESDLWLPGESIEITDFNGQGDRVKVVTEHGISVSTEV